MYLSDISLYKVIAKGYILPNASLLARLDLTCLAASAYSFDLVAYFLTVILVNFSIVIYRQFFIDYLIAEQLTFPFPHAFMYPIDTCIYIWISNGYKIDLSMHYKISYQA